MKKTGAQIILDYLLQAKVEFVTGIPGGSNLPLYDELGRSRIRHVLARHEQGAGFIAQGYARSTGKPGIVFVTSGPGATNLVTAIADAFLDSVPLLAISGQVGRSLRGTSAFQEVRTSDITRPIAKAEFYVEKASDLIDIIPKSLALTVSGRPGPVLIDVPRDVFLEEVEIDTFLHFQWPGENSTPEDEEILLSLRLLRESKRPLILAGGGMRNIKNIDLFIDFVTETGIPVINTLMGTGALPTAHPLAHGMVGMHGSARSTAILERADLLLALGTRFGDRSTGKTDDFAKNAKIIHVDLDKNEHSKIIPAHTAIHSGLEPFLEGLHSKSDELRVEMEWQKELAAISESIPLDPPGMEDPTRPAGFLRRLSNRLPENTRVATDVGQHQMWAAQAMHFSFPGQFMTSAGLGTMGFGMPAGIGSALAGENVVVISGDGSFLMNIQEMDTAVQEKCNIKVVLMDNRQLGMVCQQQSLFMNSSFVESKFQTGLDFLAIAKGFGWQAFDWSETDDETIVRDFLSSDGPALLHVPVHPEEMVSPTVPPGKANGEAIHLDRNERLMPLYK